MEVSIEGRRRTVMPRGERGVLVVWIIVLWGEKLEGKGGERKWKSEDLPMSSQGQVLSKISGSTSLERWIVGRVVPPRVVALRAGLVVSVPREMRQELVESYMSVLVGLMFTDEIWTVS